MAACFMSSDYEKPVLDHSYPPQELAVFKGICVFNIVYTLDFFKMRKKFLSPLCWLYWRRTCEKRTRMIPKNAEFHRDIQTPTLQKRTATHIHISLHIDHTQRQGETCSDLTHSHISARWLRIRAQASHRPGLHRPFRALQPWAG